MEAKLYGQNKGGMSINGIIKDYYAYAGENISAGDLVEYVNGVAGKTDYGTSEDTQINTTSQAGYVISAVALDSNRVFIAHSRSSNYNLYGVVATIHGATIIVGTDTQLSTIVTTGATISCVLLPNGNVFIAHSYNGYTLYGMVCSIDGTTITAGTDTGISTSTSSSQKQAGYVVSACLLPNGNVFIAHCAGNDRYLYGIVCKIGGTTITAGSDTALVSSSYAGSTISTCLLPNGNVFIAHSYGSSYYLYGIVCSISGTTITKGSDTQLTNNTNGEETAVSVQPLSNGNVFIVYTYSSRRYLYGMICGVNGTAITKGTDTALSTESNAGSRISTVLLGENKYLVLHIISNVAYLYGMICEIDGSNIITGTDTEILNGTYISYTYDNILLNNGTIFVAHSKETSYYLNAQIFAIDEANNIPTNHIVATEYETQVRKVTTGQFDGIAKTSGTGGDDTGHKDKVSIWTIPVYEEVIKQGNIIPIEWVEENLYQYRADGVTLTAATVNSDTESAGLYKAYLACDNDTDTYYRGNEDSVARYEWLQWEFDEPRKITKMQVRFRDLNNIATDHVSITIQGSNNSNEWADLFSIPLPSSRGYESEITLSNVDYYKYYRIYSRNKQGYLEVHDWYVTEYAVLEEVV